MILSATTTEAKAQTRGLLTVQRVVADHYKLPIAAMTSKTRTAEYANARHVAMFVARTVLKASFPDIALAFRKKDHMSALHGCQCVTDKMLSDPAFGKEVGALCAAARRA